MSAKALGIQLPIINNHDITQKQQPMSKVSQAKEQRESARDLANKIVNSNIKPGQTFTYEVYLKEVPSPLLITTKLPCGCNGTLFMFTRENGNEFMLVTQNIVSVELIDQPKGTSDILGLDGRPADAPKPLVVPLN